MNKINFSTNVDFEASYKLDGGNTLNVKVEDGKVNLIFQPLMRSGFLRTSPCESDILSENVVYSATTDTYDYDYPTNDYEFEKMDDDNIEDIEPEDELDEELKTILNDLDVEIEVDSEDKEETDPYFEMAEKISRFDKNGNIMNFITSLLENTDKTSAKVAKTVGHILANLTDAMKDIENRMVNE